MLEMLEMVIGDADVVHDSRGSHQQITGRMGDI
jgi:hypothetical protein